MLPKALEALINELAKLPGVGPRTAERLAFFMLRMPQQQSTNLALALEDLHAGITNCQRCHNLSEGTLCYICSNDERRQDQVAVVEEALDVIALERTGVFKGVYHVLGGVLSPIDGIGPEQLNIASLVKKVKDSDVSELILATNATTEGEATALYIQRQLSDTGIKVTRLARGLPVGSDLEYADQVTLGRALEGRQAL